MRKTEYLEKIKEILKGVDEEIARDILEDYENHFEMGIKEGRSEEEIAEELGNPDDLAEEMRELCREEEENKNKEGKREGEKAGTTFSGADNENKCTRLELEVVSADVYVRRSLDGNININYENSGKNSSSRMIFTAKQVGNTLFARETIKKSGFFGINIITNASSEVYVEVPEDFESLDIRTTSGDVNIDNTSITGGYRVVSTSGDINLSATKGIAAEINSTSGDIRCDAQMLQAVRTKSVSGDVKITGVIFQNCEADSVSGDVKVTLDPNCTGYMVSSASVSGDCIINKYDTYQKEGRSRVYVYGDGNCKINAKTVSGDVRVTA